MDWSSSGRRKITTLRKLPTSNPIANTISGMNNMDILYHAVQTLYKHASAPDVVNGVAVVTFFAVPWLSTHHALVGVDLSATAIAQFDPLETDKTPGPSNSSRS